MAARRGALRPLKARYYPEDTGYLLEFEPEVQHFTVVGRSP